MPLFINSLGVLALSVAGAAAVVPSAAAEPAKQEPAWFTCDESSDCKLVDSDCGRRNAVNKNYESHYSKWLEATIDRSKCALPLLEQTSTPLQPGTELKVSCREGQCIVQERSEQGGK